jgi:hypothetical protein
MNLNALQSTLAFVPWRAAGAPGLQVLGEMVAAQIKAGNSEWLRQMAEALETWRGHRPQPDRIREAVIRFCVPPSKHFEMRDIVAHLVDAGLAEKAVRSDEHNDLRRQVYRICKETRITVRGTSGKPRHDTPKKARLMS